MKPRLERRAWLALVVVGGLLVAVTLASLFEVWQGPRLGVQAAERDGRVVVTWVQPAGPEWDAGVRPGDTLTAVRGQGLGLPLPTALANDQALEILSAAGPTIVIGPSPAPILLTSLERLAFVVMAAGIGALGWLVYARAPGARLARVSLLTGVSTAVGLIAALATPFGAAWALAVVFFACLAFGAGVFRLSLVYPVDRLTTGWGRAGGLLSLLLSALVAASYIVALLDPSTYVVIQHLWLGLVAAELLATVVIVVLGSVVPRIPGPGSVDTPSARLVGLALVAGIAPFCLLSIGPYSLGLGYVLPPQITITSMLVVPAALAAVVAGRWRSNVADLARRSVVALLVWVSLVAVFAVGLSLVLSWLLMVGAPMTRMQALASAVIVVAAMFPGLQHWGRQAIERRLFRDIYGYAETLRDMAGAIARLQGTDAVATDALARLVRTLDLVWAALVIRTDDDNSATYRWGAAPDVLDPPTSIDGAWCVPLSGEPSSTGLLLVGPKRGRRPLSRTDVSLVVTLAPVLAVALEHAFLVRQLRSRVDALATREAELAALSARLLRVQEEERHRLALDLHDDPLQRAILLARELASSRGVGAHALWLRSAEDIADSLRAICNGLRPPQLDDFGLVAGLHRLVVDVRTRSELVVNLEVCPPEQPASRRLPLELEVALYRIAQEAISNTLKHANASMLCIRLEWLADCVRLCIEDDGCGLQNGSSNGSTRAPGLGLVGMRERLRPWGGKLEYVSGPARGLVIMAEVPELGRAGL